MKALKITGIILLILVVCIAGAGIYIKTALPNVGPAPDLKIERTAARLERGSYLANHVAVCIDCHSSRDWRTFAGPMTHGSEGSGGEVFNQKMGFPGAFYAPNITPYALGSWTDGEIFRAITTGVSKNGRALFPVMPYNHIGTMDKEDVYSIIAYIRTLPAVKKDVPRSKPDFPINFLVNTMPHAAAFTTRPDTGNRLAYGQYLVNTAGCIDCHSKRDKGNIIPGTEFGGGMEFAQPGGIVRSANITMDAETGIGNWSKAAFVHRFRQYAENGYTPPKLARGDLNSPMPWMMYSGMKPDDIEAIYEYLQTLKTIRNEVKHFEKTAQK